jgi:hypothetical protein
MPWILALVTFSFVVALAAAFVTCARAIRRDLNSRFDQLRLRLEEQAVAILRHATDSHSQRDE